MDPSFFEGDEMTHKFDIETFYMEDSNIIAITGSKKKYPTVLNFLDEAEKRGELDLSLVDIDNVIDATDSGYIRYGFHSFWGEMHIGYHICEKGAGGAFEAWILKMREDPCAEDEEE
jgi:hypothetical protein